MWLSVISFGFGWIGSFLPAYRVGVLEKYWERAQFSMVFAMLLLVGLATLIVLIVVRGGHTLHDLSFNQINWVCLYFYSACSLWV